MTKLRATEKVKVKCWFKHQKPVIAKGEISWEGETKILTIFGCIGMTKYQVQ